MSCHMINFKYTLRRHMQNVIHRYVVPIFHPDRGETADTRPTCVNWLTHTWGLGRRGGKQCRFPCCNLMEFLFLFGLFFQSINTEYKDLNQSQDLKPHPPPSSTKQQPLMKEREVDSGSADPLRPSPPKKWERRPSTLQGFLTATYCPP